MCHNTEYDFGLVIPGEKFSFTSNQKHFPDLQSPTTMLRKTDVTISNFKIKLFKTLKTTTTPPPPPPKKNSVEVRQVLCTFNMFKLFREANLEIEGLAITCLRKAFLVNTILIVPTGPKKVGTVKRWPSVEIAVGLAQSVEYLTAGEVAGWIPGTGLNLTVLEQTGK